MIQLKYANVHRTGNGMCETIFKDGRTCVAWPHPDQPHYHAVAHRCGYADDLAAYCFEHEFAHSFLCERLLDRECPVLRACSEDRESSGAEAAFEELAVQAFQQFLRANQRPFAGDVNWDALKTEALKLLGG